MRVREFEGYYVRVLPSLIVDTVVERALLVIRIAGLRVKDLGLIEQFVVKTQDFFVLLVHHLLVSWRHGDNGGLVSAGSTKSVV